MNKPKKPKAEDFCAGCDTWTVSLAEHYENSEHEMVLYIRWLEKNFKDNVLHLVTAGHYGNLLSRMR